MEKRRNCSSSNFSSFPHYLIYIFLTSGVKLHIHLLNVVVQFIGFLTLSTLICRSTDISKCFSESLGIRDNGSRLQLSTWLSLTAVLKSHVRRNPGNALFLSMWRQSAVDRGLSVKPGLGHWQTVQTQIRRRKTYLFKITWTVVSLHSQL